MSEHQYYEFRAVDRPLTDAELSFAEGQSTRADVSRWSFCNEYHYGEFRGDVHGLLRRGFDVHLHYANFGIRTVAFRLSAGLPLPKSVWKAYIDSGELEWIPDQKGPGGILSLSPFHEATTIDEISDPHEYMDDLVVVRERLLSGDLRAFYALWLCAAFDDQVDRRAVVEPPVPGGLANSLDLFGPLLEFFGLDPLLLVAASEGTPKAPEPVSIAVKCQDWVERQTSAEAKQWLRRFLTEDLHAVKAEVLTGIRKSSESSDWPTTSLGRKLEELLYRTDELRAEHEAKEKKKLAALAKRKAEEEERERQKRMKEMLKDPKAWLLKATKLVEQRSTSNYRAAADILADLREAIGGSKGETMSRTHAAELAKKYPTLNILKASLRQRQLLD